MKKLKLKIYEIEYASSAFKENKQFGIIYSTTKLNDKDEIIVESLNNGIFIARVNRDITKEYICEYGIETDEDIMKAISRKFYKKVSLGDFYKNIDNKNRKEELKKEMENKFEEIDKELKFKFYAEQNEDFKKLYDEYSNL